MISELKKGEYEFHRPDGSKIGIEAAWYHEVEPYRHGDEELNRAILEMNKYVAIAYEGGLPSSGKKVFYVVLQRGLSTFKEACEFCEEFCKQLENLYYGENS